MQEDTINSTVVNTAEELGLLARKARIANGYTLEKASSENNFGLRFLSEFERGKPTAQIAKVFEALQAAGLELVLRHVKRDSPILSKSKNLDLDFPYDWSNSNLDSSTLITRVLEKARFTDILAIAKEYGIDKVEEEVKTFTEHPQFNTLNKYLSRIKAGAQRAHLSAQ